MPNGNLFSFSFPLYNGKRPFNTAPPACVCVCEAHKTLVLAAKTVKSNKILIKIQHNKQTQTEIFNKQLYSTFFPAILFAYRTRRALSPVCAPFSFAHAAYEKNNDDYKIERFIYARAYLFALR